MLAETTEARRIINNVINSISYLAKHGMGIDDLIIAEYSIKDLESVLFCLAEIEKMERMRKIKC